MRISDPETYDALPAKLNKHPVSSDSAPGELGSLCPSRLNESLDDPTQSWSHRNLLHGLGHTMHSPHRHLSPCLVPGTVLAPWDTRATHMSVLTETMNTTRKVCMGAGSWRSAFWRKTQRGRGGVRVKGRCPGKVSEHTSESAQGWKDKPQSQGGKAQVWLEQNG